MFRLLAVFLALLLAVGPAWAKAVSFDVQHVPRKELYQANKAYFTAMRQQVEALWPRFDPVTGETARIKFVIASNGGIDDILSADDLQHMTEPKAKTGIGAAMAVREASPFPPLPFGQEAVTVVATFKSKRPKVEIDTSGLMDGLLMLGVAALAGYSIYALTKSANYNDYSTHERGCQGLTGCPYCKNCRYCKWCNAGMAPCGVWYRVRGMSP